MTTDNFFDQHINKPFEDEVDDPVTSVIDDDDIDVDIENDSPGDVDEENMLPEAVRLAVKKLLKKGLIEVGRQEKTYKVIYQHQDIIRQFLKNLDIALTVDERTGMAFISQPDLDEEEGEDAEDATSLISKRTLSLYDTLVMLVLRKFYQERQTAGENVVVIDSEQVAAKMVPFLPLTNSATSDYKKLSISLKKLAEKYVLTQLKSDAERYQISPIIRHIVSAEVLEKLLEDYVLMAEEAGVEGLDLAPRRVDTLTEQEAQEGLE